LVSTKSSILHKLFPFEIGSNEFTIKDNIGTLNSSS
jgi:hypothetical protein